jgi:hypothetical protein
MVRRCSGVTTAVTPELTRVPITGTRRQDTPLRDGSADPLRLGHSNRPDLLIQTRCTSVEIVSHYRCHAAHCAPRMVLCVSPGDRPAFPSCRSARHQSKEEGTAHLLHQRPSLERPSYSTLSSTVSPCLPQTGPCSYTDTVDPSRGTSTLSCSASRI